jgi:hypothetical protein
MTKGWAGITPASNRLDGRQFIFACPKPNCFFTVSVMTEEEAKAKEESHGCPHSGEIKYSEAITLMLIEQLWREGDKYYAKMESDPVKYRGIVNGICISISIFMQSWYRTPQEVATELTKRRAHAQANEPYETPGIGRLAYTAPREPVTTLTRVREGDVVRSLRTNEIGKVQEITEDGDIVLVFEGPSGKRESSTGFSMHELAAVSKAELAKQTATTKRKAKPTREWTSQEKQAIKFASESGFTLQQIANTYDATEREVRILLGVA